MSAVGLIPFIHMTGFPSKTTLCQGRHCHRQLQVIPNVAPVKSQTSGRDQIELQAQRIFQQHQNFFSHKAKKAENGSALLGLEHGLPPPSLPKVRCKTSESHSYH